MNPFPAFPDLKLSSPLYKKSLHSPDDVADWTMEGRGAPTFDESGMTLENLLDPKLGQEANFVFWCPTTFEDDIAVSWSFQPLREPGLCIFFFAASGREGRDLFDPALPKRTGEYPQYHSGAINTLHISYYRRRYESERKFHTCNLRKSHGFYLVAEAADPLPDVEDVRGSYRIQVVKQGPHIRFGIDELPLISWKDDGTRFGPSLSAGRIGFRQMAPLKARYADLVVHTLA